MADVCIEFSDTGRAYRSRSQLIDAVPFCDRMADRHIRHQLAINRVWIENTDGDLIYGERPMVWMAHRAAL